MPKSLRDEAWLLQGGVGGGPKPGRGNCSGLLGGATGHDPFSRCKNDSRYFSLNATSKPDVTNRLAALRAVVARASCLSRLHDRRIFPTRSVRKQLRFCVRRPTESVKVSSKAVASGLTLGGTDLNLRHSSTSSHFCPPNVQSSIRNPPDGKRAPEKDNGRSECSWLRPAIRIADGAKLD